MIKSRPLVLIVDDESKIRRLVATNLELEGFDVMSAGDGEQAIEVFRKAEQKPDLIVLDLMMPGLDGMGVLKYLRAASDVPVIILSAKDERPSVMEGFNIGADDYVTKPFYIDELIARIRAVLRRSRKGVVSHASSQEALKNGSITLNLKQRQCWVHELPVKLTDTEFRLLSELMRHPGEVLTHDQLLRSVWGEEHIGDVQYLRVAFARIRRKLEESGLEGGVIASYSSVGYFISLDNEAS